MNLIGGPYAGGQLEPMAGDSQSVMIAEYRTDGTDEENEQTSVYVVYNVVGDELVYNQPGTDRANNPTPTGDER